MKIKKRARNPASKLSDVMSNPGPGMFTDERARRSMIRAYNAIKEYYRNISKHEIKINQNRMRELRKTLREIIRHYWSDYDYDHRVTYADMKKDFKPLLLRSARMQHAIINLPEPTKIALNRLMSRRPGQWATYTDHLSSILDELILLDRICKPIVTETYIKNAGDSLENACNKLWTLREEITRQVFVKTWEVGGTPTRLVKICGPRALTSPDPLFVQIVLQATNPELQVGSILDRLKRIASSKPKSE